MGEAARQRNEEIAALRTGVDLGMTLIDTAEMYGDGATETFLGEALAGLRDNVFLVSKVYPQNAGRGRIERACEASLQRLKTDHLDLYLLHWRGQIPLAVPAPAVIVAASAVALVAAAVVNQLLATRSERRHPPRGQVIEVDGVKVHHFEAGAGTSVVMSGPAIPMIGDIMRFTVSPLLGWLMAPMAFKQVFSPAKVTETFKAEFPTSMSLDQARSAPPPATPP